MMNENIKGKPEIFSIYKGKAYFFLNEDAKKIFGADPGKFTADPQTGPISKGA